MSEIIPCPSLSSAGWLKGIAEKADGLIAHFFEADKLQTAIYGNNVSSLTWLIEQYGNNATEISQQLRMALETYLSRYYTGVSVDITADDTVDNKTTGINLTIYCKIVENNKEYSFGRILQTKDSKLEKILVLNNFE